MPPYLTTGITILKKEEEGGRCRRRRRRHRRRRLNTETGSWSQAYYNGWSLLESRHPAGHAMTDLK